MTKRDAAVLGAKTLAVYLIATSLIEGLWWAAVLPSWASKYRPILTHHGHLGWAPAIASIPYLCKIILSALLWMWSSRIGSKVIPGSEDESVMVTSSRDWASASMLVLGVWLLARYLPLLLTGAVAFAISTKPAATAALGGDITSYSASGAAGTVIGLCLLVFGARRAAYASRAGTAAADGGRSLSILGIRLIAVYVGFEAVKSVSGVAQQAWLTSWMGFAHNYHDVTDSTALVPYIVSFVMQLLLALLLWRIAPEIAGREGRNSELPQPPEEPQPVEPA